MKYLMMLALLLRCLNLSAADQISNNETIVVYCDKFYKNAFKDIESTFKDTLAAKEASWQIETVKNTGIIELADSIEKELLKNKADRYIIATGPYEYWDEKNGTARDIDTVIFKSALLKIIQTLKEQGKKIHISTPHQILAGKSEEANNALSTAAQIILQTAKEENITSIDFYTAFDQKNSSGESKRMKGITTKDGYKLNDSGEAIVIASTSQTLSLSAVTLTRNLKEGDIIGFAGPIQAKQMGSFSIKLKEHFKDMQFMAPRAIGIYFSHDLFGANLISTEAIEANKPNILFIYPGTTILGKKTNLGSLEDGRFKIMFQEKIETFRKLLPDTVIFICTPLVHREFDGGNLVKINGQHFKICERWAEQTREVAKEVGLPVLDIHKRCIDWINANGAENAKFAGAKSSYVNEFEPAGFALIQRAIAETINFDTYTD